MAKAFAPASAAKVPTECLRSCSRPSIIPARVRSRRQAGEPDKTRAAIEAAAEFDKRGNAQLRLKVNPVTDDHIGMSFLGGKT